MTSRRTLVFALLALALIVLIGSTQVWAAFDLAPGAAVTDTVTITGQDTASGVFPIAIALAAMSLTLSISGRVLRMIFGILAVAFGAWIASFSLLQMSGETAELVRLGAPVLYERTGLGPSEHMSLVERVTVTAWPTATGIAGVLVVVVGVLILVFGLRWRRGGRKYESRPRRKGSDGVNDRIGDWDALSEGEDPSEESLKYTAEEQRRPASGSTEPEGNR